MLSVKIPRDLTLVLAKLDIPEMVENAQVNCFGTAILLKIKAHSLRWESRRLFHGRGCSTNSQRCDVNATCSNNHGFHSSSCKVGFH